MLKPEEIQKNWDKFLDNVMEFTEGDRQNKLLKFYTDREQDFAIIPASGHVNHHSAFPGGYVYHVNRVVEISQFMYKLWAKFDGVAGFTMNELIFSAINHDLGKVGDMKTILYREVEEQFYIKKGKYYDYNPAVTFMSIPDRSIFLLNQMGIILSENEFITIKTHDGLYDEANKAYLLSPSTPRLKNNMTYILHQADMLAARIAYSLHQSFLFPEAASEVIEPKVVNSNLKNILNML